MEVEAEPEPERADSPLKAFSDDSSSDDGEELTESPGSRTLWCCHCSTSPASSQTAHIVALLVREHGWKEWPTEEHQYPGSTSKVMRPKECKKLEFCNSGYWSKSFEISIDQTELLYDRVNLAKLTSSRDCTSSDICPATYVLRHGKPAPRIHPATGPQLFFLKKNLSNYGLGVVAVKTPEEALSLVEPDGEYVLQPHIPSPVLYHGRKFHLRLYLLIAQRKSWSEQANIGGARFYAHRPATKMAVSAHKWSESAVDKVAQITTVRTHKFEDWEQCDPAWSAMIETTLSLCKQIAPHLRRLRSGKTKFEMLGADYMLERTADGSLKAWLLEVNTGPVMGEEDDSLCHDLINTVMDPLQNPSGEPNGGWEALILHPGS